MVPKKPKSKRLSIKDQKKIHKRATEKHRKDRRDAKRNPQKRKLKKDPGIPNLLPFKDKVLQQIEEHREQVKQDKLRQKEARSQLHDKNRNLDTAPKTIAELAKSAQKRDAAYESARMDSDMDDNEVAEGAVVGRRDNSKRAYYREFQKVVQHADVILQVLDARDPLGTRAPQIERMIMDAGANKRIILILNKIDLVPRDVVGKWLTYLRHEFPTLAFKASTQDQRKNLGHAAAGSKKAASLNTAVCVGADSLIQLLKNYSRNQKIKTSITVGVIGFPNVGKSSLINSLKRARVCGVGSTPGFTKFVQEIHLDSKLKLLDCPGIVFNSPAKGSQKLDKTAAAEMMLRNCIKVELLDDPIAPVDLIVQRCNPAALQVLYNVPAFMDTRDFLVGLARQRGMLKRQGIADLIGAARVVLGDWNRGKIPFYTLPPGMSQNSKTAAGDAAAAHGAGRAVMVNEWSKEFDIDALLGEMDSKVLDDASAADSSKHRVMVMEGRSIAQDADLVMEDVSDSDSDSADYYSESDAMEEDEAAATTSMRTVHIINLPATKKKGGKSTAGAQNKTVEADQMAEDSNDNDDYDFGTYFKKPQEELDYSDSDEEL
ncbi:nuclear GTP-binding protein nug1 [Coemansia brasiliensis]|uniref:Nuclear GTP-binding protein nug1 n=1 Tax=Coemansia brasiliensis TaxID=2650707 RepID=A0A9W8I994_9FUNG|nr:nuclear GTP-binding protein nug1 [Coemansia brasiliensis]